jgi:hypothetical protein
MIAYRVFSPNYVRKSMHNPWVDYSPFIMEVAEELMERLEIQRVRHCDGS